jgi:hypothetical protein
LAIRDIRAINLEHIWLRRRNDVIDLLSFAAALDALDSTEDFAIQLAASAICGGSVRCKISIHVFFIAFFFFYG